MEKWSLIDDAPSSAAYNMAVDEYLLREAEKGQVRPVLRIYSFDPPAVTIGFHQDPLPILDLDSLSSDGIDIVRRITGGRALLHDGELTYSVIARTDHPSFEGSLQQTFLSISDAVVTALREIGVDAGISGGKRNIKARQAGQGPAGSTLDDERRGLDTPCLISTSRHEVTAGGKKIVGSAQRRGQAAFLQHGSILLQPSSEKIARYLLGDFGDLSAKITSVEAETGSSDAVEALKSAMTGSFAKVFRTSLESMKIDDEALREIESEALIKSREFAGGEMTG